MQKQNLLLALLLFGSSMLHATHNYSGEIVFKKTGALTVEATIVTFTRASSIVADRDTLELVWGDGTIEKVARSNGNGNGVEIGNNLKYNLYVSTHTYAAYGIYTLSMTDYNRSGQIINVNPPASDNIPFHLESMVRLMPDAASSTHSPVLLLPPVDIGYIFQPFVHLPNAFDLDGDSLVYELVVPMQGSGLIVPNYSFPDQIAPSDDNKVIFNPQTGEFNWTTPIVSGDYCIAILIKAYHDGLLVESIRRDMMIFVQNSANQPPQIALNPDIQPDDIVDVMVGQTVELSVLASDPDAGQMLTLSASGGPLDDPFQEKATFVANGNEGQFTWNVTQEFLREQPYQIVFKAKDDFFGNGLSTFRSVRYRVLEMVGVNTTIGLLPLHLYPNPAATTVQIDLPTALEFPATLKLLNSHGQLQLTEQFNAVQANRTLQISELPPGMYFVEIQSVGGNKFVGQLQKS